MTNWMNRWASSLPVKMVITGHWLPRVPAWGEGALTGAIDLTRYDGPWDLAENLEQEELYLSYLTMFGTAEAKFTLQGYWSDWDATDQILCARCARG